MDGIVRYGRQWPRNGTPRPMHVLLFSTDPVALDATVCRMINLDESLVNPSFTVTNLVWATAKMLSLLANLSNASSPPILMSTALMPAPVPIWVLSPVHSCAITSARARSSALKQCTQCGRCEQACPAQPKALTWANGKKSAPVYNYDYCIRCYCCQELCPHEAIQVQVPLMGRLFRR